jgi:hypothetical protein
MVNQETPRTRSLLRQAARNVEAGKFVAAEQLYRQIIDEAPNSVPAWIGLAEASQDVHEKEKAYEQALLLDPENDDALAGLVRLRGDALDEGQPEITRGNRGDPKAREQGLPQVEERAVTTASGTATEATEESIWQDETAGRKFDALDHDDKIVAGDDVELVCYRHPQRSTSLRCYKCSKPICSECTHKTPVGYLCPDCYREAEDAFFNAKLTDYLLSLLIALPLSLVAGWLVVRFSGGFFMILIFIFAGGAVGGFIARLSKRVIGNRRGRYIPHLIAACIVIGVLFFAWPGILAFIAGNPNILWRLVGMGIYLFTAASSAFYWAR